MHYITRVTTCSAIVAGMLWLVAWSWAQDVKIPTMYAINKRSELIPGAGIDVKGFERALAMGPSPTQLRHELGLGTAEIVITVTRMTRQKGIPTLLKAAALVHEARPGVRFLLVGPRQSEGPLAVSQAEIDRHAPYVKALGPRSDVPALLSLADVFAFPTEYREGVPRVLLEAALAGLPIVPVSYYVKWKIHVKSWDRFQIPLPFSHCEMI